MKTLYLVTGASGHLGNTLCRMLLAQKKQVRILLMEQDRTPLPFLHEVEVFYGDICDRESLQAFFEKPDEETELCVIHCAGIVSIASRFEKIVYTVNVSGCQNIVDLCEEKRVKKLVYVSSVHAAPESPEGTITTETKHFDPDLVRGLYAKTKAQATAYVLRAAERGLNATVVQPSGLVGPFDFGSGNMTQLLIDYYRGRLTAGVEGGYDFVDVRDVAAGILAACEKGERGECYFLTGRYITVRELLNLYHEVTGKRRVRTILPMWFAKGTAYLAEAYYKMLKQPPLYTPYSLYTLSIGARFSNQKARQKLGFRLRSMLTTARDSVRWLKAQGRI